jgi:hypothetical protein
MSTGHCLCGFVSYEYSGKLGPAGYCHCEDCRRCTGSAFGVSVRVEVSNLRLLTGRLKSYSKVSDGGSEITRHFCPECGSPVFTSSPRHPEFIFLKAGLLDDAAAIEPVQQMWVQSRVAWAVIGPELTAFARGRTEVSSGGMQRGR